MHGSNENIINMHAVPTSQIEDILHFNDKYVTMISPYYIFCSAKTINLKECVTVIVFGNINRAIHRLDGYYWNCDITQYF